MNDHQLTTTWWPSLFDTSGEVVEYSWPALGRWLAVAKPRPANAENELSGWSPAKFENDTREKETARVEYVTSLVYDLDKGGVSVDQIRAAYREIAAFVHSTRRSTPTAPRWRVILRLSRNVTEDEYPALWRAEASRLASHGIVVDPSTKNATRFWFVPCEPLEGKYVFVAFDGAPLDVDAAIAAAERHAQPPHAPERQTDSGAGSRWGKAALDDAFRRVAGASNGARNSTLNDQAFGIGQIVGGGAIDEAVARRELADAAKRAGLGASESAKTIDSGIEAGKKKPRTRPEAEPGRVSREAAADDRSSSAGENPWLSRLVTVDPLWVAAALPPRTYFMRDERTGFGAIPERGFGLLVAAGGVGKSYATIDMSIAGVCGVSWCGVMEPESIGRVLIVTAEDPADELRRRIFDIARTRGLTTFPPDALDIIDVHDRHVPFLDEKAQPTAHAKALLELVAARGPYVLVIVDPLARLSGASIDGDNVAACALATYLESVASAARGFVLGVHHTSQTARRMGITDATAIRGATGLGDSARLVMVMTVESVDVADTPSWSDLGEIVTLSRAKANHVARWEPIQLRRGEHGVLVPLDAVSRDIVNRARASSDPRTKRQAKTDERELERVAKAEAVIRDALSSAREGLSYRGLRGAARRAMGKCSDATLDAAIAGLGPAIRKVDGPKNSTLHFLAQEAS